MNDKELFETLKDSDKDINPSAALMTDTVSAMNQPAKALEYRRKPLRLALIFAAVMVTVAVMVSAGFQVFEYIFFRPGTGIVTDDGSQIISALERAVKLDRCYIEACSREMNEDGTSTLTVITNYNDYDNLTGKVSENLTATADGVSYTLEFTHGGTGISYYECKSFTDSDVFTLSAYGDSVDIELAPIDMTRFAAVKYPICHGVTFVMFPLSDGSSMLAYTLAFTPEDDGTNLPRIYAQSESVTPEIVDTLVSGISSPIITDVNGEVYNVVTFSASWSGEKVDSSGGYLNGEHIVSLDRRLEADIASITLDNVSLNFKNPDVFSGVSCTIPQLGETVQLNDVYIDTLGLYDAPASLSCEYAPDQKRNGVECNTLNISFDKALTSDIPYVTEAEAKYYFATDRELADNTDSRMLAWGMASSYNSETGNKERKYHRSEQITEEMPVLVSGNAINLFLESISLCISGDWTIDFCE